ncbi:hypothetical protein CDAR_607131 [Caerostris darwini]|uniref:Uncharacterized protein n=1 Tax=Caerostris darwini TaxID=1538125 RepID=A0AAV4TE75_9ARAC|nr:hypothetical protein CDAR_607131 [Caerostris darwini]
MLYSRINVSRELDMANSGTYFPNFPSPRRRSSRRFFLFSPTANQIKNGISGNLLGKILIRKLQNFAVPPETCLLGKCPNDFCFAHLHDATTSNIQKNDSAFHTNVSVDVSCLGVGRLTHPKLQVIQDPGHSSTSHFPRDSSGVNG